MYLCVRERAKKDEKRRKEVCVWRGGGVRD